MRIIINSDDSPLVNYEELLQIWIIYNLVWETIFEPKELV